MKPKTDTDLNFLTAVERGEVVSQSTLAQRLGIAVGLINALLKRAVNKGYVKVRQAPYKRYAYYLTAKGFAEKSRLVGEYLESSLQFFRLARLEYSEIFQRVRSARQENLVLAGDGELAEIALLSANAEGVRLRAIIDPASNQEYRHGVPILKSLDLLDTPPDVVILTASKEPQRLYEELRTANPSLAIQVPALLRITPRPDEQGAPAGMPETTKEV
ncbi:winged helix-turn-helix transcriptional regulator [Ferrovibrio sp.]|uniref:winged helix-turn-helix transcriptional regulator n=1 Tax=Ferrovibrio sp. TaxID=1917215 RepID=UPI003D26CE98